jgi:hypothetical protein
VQSKRCQKRANVALLSLGKPKSWVAALIVIIATITKRLGNSGDRFIVQSAKYSKGRVSTSFGISLTRRTASVS